MAKKTSAPKTTTKTAIAKKRKFGFKKRSNDSPKPELEGFVKFSRYVLSVLRVNKGLFGSLLLLYVVLSMVVIGFSQQSAYAGINDTLNQLGAGALGPFSKSFVLFGTTVGGSLNTSLSVSQQTFIATAYLFMWLVVIWLLRYRLAGTAVKLRDGLYNAGAPIISTLMLLSLAAVQFIPASIGFIAYSTATSSGLLKGPIEVAIFGTFAIVLIVLSLYWLTTTLFALIIATVPGSYPMKAHKTAREIMLGQRFRLLVRLLWLALLLLLTWAIVLLPCVLITNWLNVSSLPLVAVAVQVLTGWSLIYGTAYVYLLYRKMINEPTTK